MKQFMERLQNDKDFAMEFRAFMTEKNNTVKEGTRLVGEHLNKLVMGAVKEFAASKGMELKDDAVASKPLAALTKQICMQMDDMIVKSFGRMEGSMKQPVDVPQEMIKAVRENKDLYMEIMHKADKAAGEAVKKCGKELDAAVMASLKEFADKVGYHGPYPSAEMNKMISAELNKVVMKQIKGLMEISKTA